MNDKGGHRAARLGQQKPFIKGKLYFHKENMKSILLKWSFIQKFRPNWLEKSDAEGQYMLLKF